MRKLMVTALAVWTAAAVSGAVKGTVSTESDQKSGEIKWNTKAKSYTISQKQGSGMIDVDVPLADVTALDIQKPAGFDQLAAQVAKGQGSSAIAGLAKIAKEYVRLQWDRRAGRLLVQAYLDANQPEKALAAAKGIIDTDKSAAYKGELAPGYWQAMLALNQKEKLEDILKKATASGDRYSSGAALLMRGDIVFKEGGENADAAKKALQDGYLRVVLMYTDKPVEAELRPEGLFKSAQCFEKLGQSARADAYRGELKRLYPQSMWAMK